MSVRKERSLKNEDEAILFLFFSSPFVRKEVEECIFDESDVSIEEEIHKNRGAKRQDHRRIQEKNSPLDPSS